MENRYPALRCSLLRPRTERPNCRAAEDGDELAAFHFDHLGGAGIADE
jgi:hypothetical protein